MHTMELITVRKWIALAGLAVFVWPSMGTHAAEAVSIPPQSTTTAIAAQETRSMKSEPTMSRHTPAAGVNDPISEIRVRRMVSDALIYVIDNDGRFPSDPKTFAQSIADDSESTMAASTVSRTEPNPFTFNTALAGTARIDVDDPKHTVLVYEGYNGHLNYRHNNHALVAFVDGHVENITPRQAMSLKWKP